MESTESINNSPEKANITRRSRKVKNLEQEVEMILAQDDSRDNDVQLPKTPTASVSDQLNRTPRASEVKALKDLAQTPRRSCRKSIKPAQDYDDIIKKSMRSVTRSSRKTFLAFDEENEENQESQQVDPDQTITWSSAQVGKSSTKRKRKSRRNFGAKANVEKHIVGDDDDDNKDPLDSVNEAVAHEKNDVVNCAQRQLDIDSAGEQTEKMSKGETNKIPTDSLANEGQQVLEMEQQKTISDECGYNPEQISLKISPQDADVEKKEVVSVQKLDLPLIVIEDVESQDGNEQEQQNKKSMIVVEHIPTHGKVEQEKEGQDKETQQEEEQENEEQQTVVPEKDTTFEANPEEMENKQGDLKERLQMAVDAAPEEDVIYLMQEDSDDCEDHLICPQEIEIKKEKNSLDKIIEVSLVKKEVDTEADKNSVTDNFGCYLKSKDINVTDLGLIPLNDDDEEEGVEDKNSIKATIDQFNTEMEEMPSLIICDDEEEEEVAHPKLVEEAKEPQKEQKLNETFEADKEEKPQVQVIVGKSEEKLDNVHSYRNSYEMYDTIDNSMQSFLRNEADAFAGDDEMDALKMSEDEETPRKVASRSALKTNDQQSRTLLSTPKQLTTPKHTAQPFRFPTPYRNNSKAKEPTSSSKLLLHHNNMGIALTSLEPKEIVLRGIRKRSLSVCLGGEPFKGDGGSATKRQRPLKGPLATHRQRKAVNFHSPANQTTIIDDLDKLIAESVKKDSKGKEIHQHTNVTKRRKRSLSLDDTMMSKSLISKLPRPANYNSSHSTFSSTTSGSSSSSTTSTSKLTRTKLPNFAAIHQKQFQKMENLVDHMTRKQERSKVLINSASKIKTASAQKNVAANINDKGSANAEKPKALKKIDLGASTQIKNKSMIKPPASKSGITKIQNKASKENCGLIESNLPDPRRYMNKHQQYLFKQQHLKPTQSFNMSSKTTSATSKSNTPLKKPIFNLSTQLGKPTATVRPQPKTVEPPSSSTSASTSTSSSGLSTQDKMASRLQRHMDLFKGRVPAARAGVAARKIDANIRGVRSNRRFELQMQHRKNLEN